MSKVIDYISGCGGNNFVWEIKTTSFQINKSTGYFIDTSSGAVTASLPDTAQIGDSFYIVDATGAVDETNKIVIDNNNQNIMGYRDKMVITNNYMTLYFVYADAGKGWIIADGKGCDQEIDSGEISVDTTVYLAPSAASQSYTGVIGDDVTGDGSAQKPFFSVKRAIEHLENFSIKPGTYVTIRGLSGKYYYNDSHAVVIEHKDTKFIKIKYDVLESGYYHNTTITTDPVTVVNNTDHDLITFTVANIGTGVNQIQAGDYIRIAPYNANTTDIANAVWGGFYKVTATNGNQITIEFRRHQESGNYSSYFTYLLPTTLAAANTHIVTKYSSHVYINCTSGYFIKSDFGLGAIRANASSDNYYGCSFIRVYDGVTNEMNVMLNGFATGILFKNLECNMDVPLDNYGLTITSCGIGFDINDSIINIPYFIVNCCAIGISFSNTTFTIGIISTSRNSIAHNIYNGCIRLLDGSTGRVNDDTATSPYYTSVSSNNAFIILNNCNLIFTALNSYYSFKAISMYGAYVRTYHSDSSPIADIRRTTIDECTSSGINMAENSQLTMKKVTIRNCTYGIRSYDSIIRMKGEFTTYSYCYYCDYGLYSENSNVSMSFGYMRYSTYDGIRCYNTYALLIDTYITENSRYGIAASYNSRVMINNQNIIGANPRNNANYNVYVYRGSSAHISTHSATASTYPAKNTTPAYSGVNSASYIVETVS